ncbi:putative vacuolar sorting protein 35 [Besnoitia besnoiti]|uniref:Vacuolar protein sorting-associated protein 35 n=1 Tax=Besnoitia besnoiti TaxID=94643 RepID=A0A2A9MEW5_BESBE|nr:putative vacuolar sorting protein 35 [Besnoitia besnoiti]PFH36429.1 putative vacuolar sorting protein 35 [Besnoitia besnoiti]
MIMEHDQEKLLDEASAVVKEQARYMKRAIDSDNLRDALKHASNMICELRTSLLSPKTYYELYMLVFHELQHLSAFFSDKSRHNRKMSELYESVQHAGNILPRLYLLITVGASYIKSREAPACDILRDMTELCKGVQHPMRGLFLRFYLTQMCKDKLPDVGSEYEREGGGTMNDAFAFLLTNFTEAARLWVRLQHQGSARERLKREKERHDLRVLVGSTLVRMAQLDGMSVEFYKEEALPRLLEQVVGCRDGMAQQYLLDCIIQVFSDECHLQTLDPFLQACLNVQPSVDLKAIFVNLLNRLANFVQSEPESVPADVDVFTIFRRYILELQDRYLLSLADASAAGQSNGASCCADLTSLLELQMSFLSFALTLYPDRIDHVDGILASTALLLSRSLGGDQQGGAAASGREKLSPAGVEAVVELLSSPLRSLSLSVLELEHFPALMGFLDYDTRKQVAVSMVSAVLGASVALDQPSALTRFLDFISPLVFDGPDTPVDEEESGASSAFSSEQQSVSKLVHLIYNADTDLHFALLCIARQKFGEGGLRRLRYTLPPLVIAALQLVPRVLDRAEQHQRGESDLPAPSVSAKKVFQFVHGSCTQLVQCDGQTALRLFLMSAIVADNANLRVAGSYEAITYEYLTQALVCYEEEISDSKSQFNLISEFVGSVVGHIHTLEKENHENISAKITQHAAKLLKRPDQCRAILACSHLFWNNERVRDSRRVLECLQKCLKIADIAVQSSTTHVGLFTDILDKYIYYYERDNHEVTVDFIQNLLALCAEHVNFALQEAGQEEALANFRNTVRYLKHKKETEGAKWRGLTGLNEISVSSS